MFAVIFFLILIFGGFGFAYWKSEGFRKVIKGIFSASGSGPVSQKEIDRANSRLTKEKERTKMLQDWANIQTAINAEHAKQAASRTIIQGGKK